ncbi:MAG TPA: hypothetical protein VGM56_26305 [Byssovorax sp.]|jgi:hypothetical protein
MRASTWLFGGLSCVCAALGAAAGCSSFDVCSEGLCGAASESGSGAGPTSSTVTGTGGSASTASASGGGGAGGGGPNCDPGVGAIDPSCQGVYVSSSLGDDTGDGSKAHPVKTLATAFSLAGGTLVYACGELFASSVHVPAGTALYGGLRCATDWSYDASTPTQIIGNADTPAVTLDGGAGVTVLADLAIAGGDAQQDGGSSIAVFATDVTATIERCAVTSGRPHAGSTPPPGANAMNNGTMNGHFDGNCPPSDQTGGAGGTNSCAGGLTPDGGNGGDAKASGLMNGAPGGPNGMGGLSGLASVDPTMCTVGGAGAPSSTGPAGAGAPSLGTLASGGYQSPAATAGTAGMPGFGGGGGGATSLCSGFAAGGGGGAGGCGGDPGRAGISGGSSIGVASVRSHLTLDHTTVTAEAGATGGAGSAGGFGVNGGTAEITGAGCPGGDGGKGGAGGPGGGGAGGSSLGVAVQSGGLPMLASSSVTVMSFGTGGLGGDMLTTSATRGKDGTACRVMNLMTQTCVE